MNKQLKKINEGFTIVEVLIVLAIAALILVIILIAVPDLQRSSRNTGIYHDAQNVASAVQSYEGNNDGALPYKTTDGAAQATVSGSGSVTIGLAAEGATADAHVQKSDKVYYNEGALTGITFSGTPSATAMAIGEVLIDSNAKCPALNQNSVNSGAGNGRSVAIFYPIEGSATTSSSVGCIQE